MMYIFLNKYIILNKFQQNMTNKMCIIFKNEYIIKTGNNKMNKQKILSFIKNKIFIGVVCFIIGGAVMSDSNAITELNASIETLNQEITEKDSTIKELQNKVEEAKPWFEMKDEERKAEEERIAKEKAEREAAEEIAKREAEAKQQSKIGEKIIFTYGSKGEFALTIDSVNLTSERNRFADPVKNVVEISYTVENISMDELDFFMDNQAEFYDADGFKCNSYPNSSGAGTYDIAKGKKASGKEFVGITNSNEAYLEMNLGGTEYKWLLK